MRWMRSVLLALAAIWPAACSRTVAPIPYVTPPKITLTALGAVGNPTFASDEAVQRSESSVPDIVHYSFARFHTGGAFVVDGSYDLGTEEMLSFGKVRATFRCKKSRTQNVVSAFELFREIFLQKLSGALRRFLNGVSSLFFHSVPNRPN